MDAVLTTDPKTRSDVESWVDVPYGPSEIVSASGLSLGPGLKPIARWLPRMAIVNGVRVLTANHQTGYSQFARFKTNVSSAMPTLLEVIGGHREGQPLAYMHLAPNFGNLFSPNKGFINVSVAKDLVPSAGQSSHGLLDYISSLNHDDLYVLSDTLRAQAKELSGSPGSAASAREAADFFEAVGRGTPFKEEKWWNDDGDAYVGRDMQRCLWALENDLTACVFCGSFGWDTHINNFDQQTDQAASFFPMLDRFLDELSKRSNPHGLLAENTLVIVGSELGRHPGLNYNKGKDHFPEAPILLLGAGINTGGGKGAVYGRTGKSMQSLPVSISTGVPGGPKEQILTLDDLGATVLHIAGLQPGPNGYPGRVLDFLVAS
jgi:hypothetical protein